MFFLLILALSPLPSLSMNFSSHLLSNSFTIINGKARYYTPWKDPYERPESYPFSDIVDDSDLFCQGISDDDASFGLEAQLVYREFDLLTFSAPISFDCLYFLQTHLFAQSHCNFPARCSKADYLTDSTTWWGEEFGICIGFPPSARITPVYFVNQIHVSFFSTYSCPCWINIHPLFLKQFGHLVILPRGRRLHLIHPLCYATHYVDINVDPESHVFQSLGLRSVDEHSDPPSMISTRLDSCISHDFGSLREILDFLQFRYCCVACSDSYTYCKDHGLPDCQDTDHDYSGPVDSTYECFIHFNATHGFSESPTPFYQLHPCSNPIITYEQVIPFHEEYDFPFIGNLLRVLDRVVEVILKLVTPIITEVLQSILRVVYDMLLSVLGIIVSTSFPIFEFLTILFILYLHTTKLIQSLLCSFIVIVPFMMKDYIFP